MKDTGSGASEERMTALEWQKAFAKRFFNETWRYLERAKRSAADDTMMLHSAHASRALWQAVGGPIQHAMGEWQVARVYCTLDRVEPALYHARACLAIADANGFSEFNAGFPLEAMARALSLAGDPAAHDFFRRAHVVALSIKDDEDRKILEDDLATIELPPLNR